MTADTSPAYRNHAFLCGANMDPVAIRSRWPSARFVAIARASGVLTEGLGLPRNAFGPDLWGIVVDTGSVQRGVYLPVTLRDGTATTSMLVDDGRAVGSLPEILAQARYWELPEAYRDQIEAHLQPANP